MTPEQETEILRLRDAKVAPKQIARQLNLRPAEVSAFLRAGAETVLMTKVREGKLPPIHECLINANAPKRLFPGQSFNPLQALSKKLLKRDENDQIGGLAEIIVARQEGKRLSVGTYLVDYWCMGVKNVMPPRLMGSAEYELMKKMVVETFSQPFEEISLEQAQAVIYGALDYAQSLGIAASPYFNSKAQAHLGGRPDSLLPIQFGKNGRPYFISGPNDKVDQILATLDANVGQGNYDYLALLDDFVLTEL